MEPTGEGNYKWEKGGIKNEPVVELELNYQYEPRVPIDRQTDRQTGR